MSKYLPIGVEEMRKKVEEKAQKDDTSEELVCRVAVVLGLDFPPEVADLYCKFDFRRGTEVVQIPCTDPRVEAVEGGKYRHAPMGALVSGEDGQPMFLLKPEYAREFDFVEAVSFFKYQGGIVCVAGFAAADVEQMLEWGP